jgi:imidazole glycerol-phosphate synthase subunit HisH
MITIIDIGVSNLESVRQAFSRIGVQHTTSSDPDVIASATSLILPGVGSFGDAMNELRRRKLIDPICQHAAEGKPVLGICLGMQLLTTMSEEDGPNDGLDLISGKTIRIAPKDPSVRVPNIGWSGVHPKETSTLFTEFNSGDALYFIHSYHVVCDNSDNVSAVMKLGEDEYTAAFEYQNLFGVQFHPEKSQDAGLDILHAFCRHTAP